MRQGWEDRANAIGRVQGRYLLFLLIAAIFYGGVAAKASETPYEITLPVIDLEINSTNVLLTAPTVIMFLLLGFFGTTNAMGYAQGLNSTLDSFEKNDCNPNLVDMVFYIPRNSDGSMKSFWAWLMTTLSYPFITLLLLLESAYLMWVIWGSKSPMKVFALGSACIFAVPTVLRYIGLLQRTADSIIDGYKTRRKEKQRDSKT